MSLTESAARRSQLLAELQQRRGANTAAHNSDLAVFAACRPGDRGHIKSVAAWAGHRQGVALFQGGQLLGSLTLDLIQESQCAGRGVKIMHADGAGQDGRFVGSPGAQHKELPRLGRAAGIRPLHRQAADIRCNGTLAQYRYLTFLQGFPDGDGVDVVKTVLLPSGQ